MNFNNYISVIFLGGTCVNLNVGTDAKIEKQMSWKNGGMAFINLKFDHLKPQFFRRAGIIQDFSFFEIQLDTRSSVGNIELFPGKYDLPIDGIKRVESNKFQLDLNDDESVKLSTAGYIQTKLRFR